MSVEGVLLTIFERTGVSEETAREITQAMTMCVGSMKQAYETRIDQLERLVYVPGLWRCAKCKFQLNKIEIHAHSGAMRADNTPDDCPNCKSPLWRVTERDAGNTMCDRLEDALLKLRTVSDSWIETTKERNLLKDIWEFASDMLLAERNQMFADENGTAEDFKQKLIAAVKAYEEDYQEFEDMNEQQAPRITPDILQELIAYEYYFTANTMQPSKVVSYVEQTFDGVHPSLALHTFCVLVMKSGATITGESCCASPENFDEEKGRNAARMRAITKAFELEGYKLAAERKATAQ